MVTYIRRKTLLNKSGVEWTDYNCNHYKGCIHNCQYPCYARILSHEKQEQWQRVRVVENALELAVKEIRKVPPGARIMVSSMTDPYQEIEATEKLTRSLLPVLGNSKATVIIITKSDLVRRDFDLIKQFPNIRLCMTITSCDNIPKWEPNAPGNAIRIKVLRDAHRLGIYTIASIEPWIPGVTKPMHLVRLIWPYVNEVFIGSWNYHYRKGSQQDLICRRIYKTWLPEIIKYLQVRMVKVVVKKELTAKLVDLK